MICIISFGCTQNLSTPLMFAAQNGHVDIVRTLVERGADVSAKNKV